MNQDTPGPNADPSGPEKVKKRATDLRAAASARAKARADRGPAFSYRDWNPAQRRTLALIVALILAATALASVAAFFIVLQGPEKILVPDVRGMDLAEAMVKLQERELYPRLALRFTDNPLDRNTILEQSPAAGSIVKAGRRIQLTVSKGVVTDKVEDYVGKNLDQVKAHIQALFASTSPLITVRDPPILADDDSPAGTILEQKPAAGTALTGPVRMDFVVSRGPAAAGVKVPALQGLSITDALALVARENLQVDFTMRNAKQGETPGTVLSQSPASGSTAKAGNPVKVTVSSPASRSGIVNGLFVHTLPVYPYPVNVSLEAVKPAGERVPILALKHPGGAFSAPFSLPAGSTLVLYALDREVTRSEVKTP